MKERGLLFSGPMVRANREGRKTQTRRLMKPQPMGQPTGAQFSFDKKWHLRYGSQVASGKGYEYNCPYGVVGDRFYMRETFAIFDVDGNEDVAIGYKADNTYKTVEWFTNKRCEFTDLQLGIWRSGRFMPKWAARPERFEITDIKVDKLVTITNNDVIADGFNSIEAFKMCWNKINEKRGYSWVSNPYVWILQYRKV